MRPKEELDVIFATIRDICTKNKYFDAGWKHNINETNTNFKKFEIPEHWKQEKHFKIGVDFSRWFDDVYEGTEDPKFEKRFKNFFDAIRKDKETKALLAKSNKIKDFNWDFLTK